MPTFTKMPHFSLDSLGKEAYLPRPAGGAAEKNWQLVSPVTVANLHLYSVEGKL